MAGRRLARGVKKGLRELNIRGLGVIEDATLNLEPGFTVITGETGAGKTMVVTALSLLMGGRADVSAIRHGSDKASLSARLIPNEGAVDLAQELGGDIEDGELLITRTLSRDGKNRAVLGGAPTTLNALSDLGEELIALHAQSSTFRLLKGSRQREIIDLFGGDELSKELIKYQKLFKEYRLIISEIEKILSLNQARESEIKRINEFFLNFNKVKPILNEVKSLRERADQLENVDSFTTGLQQANLSLGEDESSALVQISQAKRAIEGIPANSKEIDDLKIEISQLQILVNELTRSISSQLDSLESNPQELETINLRRSELSALFRKFSVDQYEDPAAELISRADADAKLLTQLQDGDGAVAELENRKAIISEDLGKSANKLTALRKVVAEKLSLESTNEIKALAMPNAKLIIEISPTSSELSVLFAGELLPCGSFGSDDATFLLIAHPGAPALPIQKGASGGELSRVMLAIELVLAQTGSVPTYLFDEVDAGVGGKAAVEVGRRLALLARHAQVLVVTHLPQVAAWADQHFAILKSSTESVTSSDIKLLTSEERVSEIARMMTGLSDSSSAQEHAGELLDLVKMEKGRAQVR
ncbi:MAG: DNA repair protein RecN [Actinobacteria bacterium]|nr:DNA repair protein RecN [Actinomycetota bacterium]MSY67412.1 DNA repair protein RecN [Actinomycetota bacterium]MTA00413.1 DNA repair protein RecN [Actinomycetota bacterium]